MLLRKADESSGPLLAGLWAGLLGVVEDGETLEEAARRIASPLELPSLRRVARFTFTQTDDPIRTFEHEMIAQSPSGPLPDGARWVPRAELDFASMPADDALWYGRVLDGELLLGDFHFAAGGDNQLECSTVRAVDKLIDDEPAIGEGYTRIMQPDGTDDSAVRYVD